jgi:hypothetical protein
MRIENSMRRPVLRREVEGPRTRHRHASVMGLLLMFTFPGVLLARSDDVPHSPAGQHWGAGRFGGRR